jgi:diguanylate cyclase (GGDEF)-like protein
MRDAATTSIKKVAQMNTAITATRRGVIVRFPRTASARGRIFLSAEFPDGVPHKLDFVAGSDSDICDGLLRGAWKGASSPSREKQRLLFITTTYIYQEVNTCIRKRISLPCAGYLAIYRPLIREATLENPLKEETNQAAPSETIQSIVRQIQISTRQAVRRQWWLWSTGVMVAILLVLGVASFAFPGLLSQQVDSEFYRLNLDLAVRGLIGLVLVFGIYVVYQQLEIHRMDTRVSGALDEIQERTGKLYKLAGRDALTDLYNREFGEQRLSEEMSRSRRHVRPLAVLRMDLNGLEKIDEGLGIASADCAIRLFAEHLQHKLRLFDIPIHLDRGAFLILLPECKASEAGLVLKRLYQMTFEFGAQHTDIAAGWADYLDGEAPQTLMMRAESSLHANKQNGNGATQPVKISVSTNGNKPGCDDRIAELTARERQVFELLAHGKCNKEVAVSLNISVRTVETHRANMMSHLGIHSASELVWYAMRNGIIDAE